jgi:hypothetical protein
MSQLKTKVVFYDEKTGRVLEEYDNAIAIGNSPNIIIVNTPEGRAALLSDDILKNERIFKGPIRLLLYAMSLADPDTSEVAIIPDKATKELGISEKTFYRWLKVLLTGGHLTRIATSVYKLNLVKDT